MIDPLQTVLIVAALVLALVTGVLRRPRPQPRPGAHRPPRPPRGSAWSSQAVIGIAQLLGGSGDPGITFVGYLLAVLVVLPLGCSGRWGSAAAGATAVLIVALLTVAFLVLRLVQIHAAA